MDTVENMPHHKNCCAHRTHRIVKKAVCITLAIMALVWFDANFHILAAMQESKIARTKMQAVFLSNGQIYFGRLSHYGIGYWRLDNAHYLQISKTPVVPSADAKENVPPQTTRTALMKLSDDVHRPENTLFIPASHILFWQNLQSDSPVARAIISGQ